MKAAVPSRDKTLPHRDGGLHLLGGATEGLNSGERALRYVLSLVDEKHRIAFRLRHLYATPSFRPRRPAPLHPPAPYTVYRILLCFSDRSSQNRFHADRDIALFNVLCGYAARFIPSSELHPVQTSGSRRDSNICAPYPDLRSGGSVPDAHYTSSPAPDFPPHRSRCS